MAAGYLSWKLREGAGVAQALEDSLSDLDGFFTFVVGTERGFAVLRDPIACKPAVMAETERYVAFGSEYRAWSACRVSRRPACSSLSPPAFMPGSVTDAQCRSKPPPAAS